MLPDNLLQMFGLNAAEYQITTFGSGLINSTWKVSGPKNYILQQINTNIFNQPDAIAQNIHLLNGCLKKTAPLWK